MSLRRFLLCILISAIAFGSALTYAEETDYFNLPLEDLLNVEVSIASTSPEAVITSPATITLFTRKKLDKLGIKTLTDLYKFIPGFYSAYNSTEDNHSYIVTRGLGQKYASNILFMYNGQRLNDDFSGGISYFIRYFDLSNAKRIEVIRGPGSAVYGANAFQGVINIITDTQNQFSLSTGNNLSLNANLGLVHDINDVQMGLNLSAQNNEGEIHNNIFDQFNNETSTDDPYESKQLEAFVKYHSLQWRYLYQSSERDNFYLYRNLSNGINNVELDNHIHQLEYKLIDEINQGITFQFQSATNERSSMGIQVPKGVPGFTEEDLYLGFTIEHESLQFSGSTFYKLADQSVITAGISYQRSQVPRAFFSSNYNVLGDLSYLGELQIFDESDLQVVADKTREISSIYGQYNWQANSNLNLTVGLRHDHYNDITSEWSPRLAAVYRLTKNHIFKALYNQAYRVPSIGDLYDDNSNLAPGSDDLKTTSLKSTEFSYSYIQDNVYHSFTLFDNDMENLIGFTNGVPSKVTNLSNNSNQGIEIESRTQISSESTLLIAYTQLFSNKSDKMMTEDTSPIEYLSPKRYANIALDVNLASNLSLNLQMNWRDQIKVLNAPSSLTLFGGLVDYYFSDDSRIRLQIHNLTDKDYYYPYGVPIGLDGQTVIQQVPARGREIEIEWQYSF